MGLTSPEKSFWCVNSLLCSSSEKMLFIWPQPFTIPLALWYAYRPCDNSESPPACLLFIKSFFCLIFKSASICLVGKRMNVCKEWEGARHLLSSQILYFSIFNCFWHLFCSDPDWLGPCPWFEVCCLQLASLYDLISFVNSDQIRSLNVKRISTAYTGH